MSDLAIIASRDILAAGVADLLVAGCHRLGISAEVVPHHLFLKHTSWEGAILYFLVEEEWTQNNIAQLTELGINILNSSFFKRGFSKPQSLATLRSSGLPVLWHLDSTDHQGVRETLASGVRLLAKSSFHRCWKHVVNTQEDFLSLSSRLAGEPWYLEPYIYNGFELKAYAIGSIIGFSKPIKPALSTFLTEAIAIAQRKLGLDLLSIDVIVDSRNGQPFIVDVNAAPAFAGLAGGELIFASFVKSSLSLAPISAAEVRKAKPTMLTKDKSET